MLLLCIAAFVVATLFAPLASQAALLNGSFENGVAYPGGLNIFSPGTPPPWTASSLTPDLYDNSGADGWPLAGIPAYGGMFQNMLAHTGNRFLGFAAGFASGGTFNESFAQSTPPLTGGQTYTIFANLAAEDTGKATTTFGGPYTGRGKVDVYLNNNLIGSLAPNTASLTWQPRSFSFVAPFAATANFNFVANVDPLNPMPSYIGIDSIRLIPEPASVTLGLIGIVALIGSTRRSKRTT
jgi:hypothetical protein